MIQTIKTTAVLGILLIVGYGVHVVLNKPPTEGDPIWNNPSEFELPNIDFGGAAGADPSAAPGNALAPDVQVASSEMPPNTPPTEIGNSNLAPAVAATFATPNGGAYPTTGATSFPPAANFSATPSGSDSASLDPGVGASPLPNPLPIEPTGQAGNASEAVLTPQPPALPPNATPLLTAQGPIATISHATTPFDDMWLSAHQKIQYGDFVSALLGLSIVYSDTSLLDVQRDQLITLLDQLAGTVIYSPQQHLSPEYTVSAGDTMESIAAQFQVPATFLYRVNSISPQLPLSAGQKLKVVNGPFRGELSVSRRELTLFLGKYYAGRFNVGIGRDLPAHASSLEVSEKSGPRPYFDARTGQSIPAGATDSPYGQVWIGLRSGGLADPALGIHDMGPAVPASDTRGCITVSTRDADDLQAILSVGSRIELTN